MVVSFARQTGASVEAEIGCMGKRETGSGSADAQNDPEKIYTDPKQAKMFVEETGIDALACSFGTTHGIYLKKPKLDFGVVRNVRKRTGSIPVVMHGGSGVSREDFREAIRAGVRKVNYFTYMDKSGGSAAARYIETVKEGEPVFFSSVIQEAEKAMKENIKEAMKIFAMME